MASILFNKEMVQVICSTASLILLLCLVSTKAELPRREHPIKPDGSLSLLVVGDWGRRGHFNQTEVAIQMGKVGQSLNIDFVISTGDNFYDNGLTGTNDPAFQESFTKIYTAPSLQKQWYIDTYKHGGAFGSLLEVVDMVGADGRAIIRILGNHDYRGDVEAQLSPILKELDGRWNCLKSFVLNSEIVEFFFVDTNPFVEKYFSGEEDHVYDWRGAHPRKAYMSTALEDLESALRRSNATWKIVVGHHPIKSAGTHGDTHELVDQLLPILQADGVDLYINGHDHCLEQISSPDSKLQFLTSGGGSQAWRGTRSPVNPAELKFYYDGQGFMSLEMTQARAQITFYDVSGNVLHQWNVSKQEHPI